MRSSSLLIPLALALVACGNSPTKKNSQPDLAVALDPAVLDVAAGDTATTTLHITRRGALAGASVTVTTDTPPDGIAIAITPGEGSDDATLLSVSADLSVTPQTVNVAVTATANTVTATDVLTIIVGLPTSINVHGSVVSQSLLPFPNTQVTVWPHGATAPFFATTAADGTFAVDTVMPPYDVLVRSASGRTLYLGLTRVDPTLVVQLDAESPVTTTTVSGVIGGGDDSEGVKAYSIDCGTAAAAAVQNSTIFNAVLAGSLQTTSQCTAQMLRFSEQSGTAGPVDYYLSGTAFVNVAPAGASDFTIPVNHFVLDTHPVAVHATTSDGLAVASVTPLWLPSVHTALPLHPTSINADVDFSVALPTDSSVRVILQLTGGAADGSGTITLHRQASATTNTLNVALPAAPFIIAPEDLTVGVDDSEQFTVTSGRPATYVFRFGVGDNPANNLAVVSALTALPAQNLAKYGVAFASDTDYHWQVTAQYGLTADQFATSASSLHDLYRSDGSLVGATKVLRFHTL